MRHRSTLVVVALVLASGVAQGAGAQSVLAARRDSVLAAVRAYVDAGNRVDVQAMLDLYSKSPGVSSAALGELRRGWEAIRAQVDSLAGHEGLMRIALGAIDVTALGPAHALAVSTVVVRVETDEGPVQLRGAVTFVLERVAGAWKVLHDHVSLPLPER